MTHDDTSHIDACGGGDADDPLQWWRDARFGLFIHWGLYSVPAGVHRGEQIPSLGEWIRVSAKIPFEEYAAYAEGLVLDRYDADQWVRLASQAGMKYLVITAKHHDGFAMFRTKASPFNIVDATPYGRDPMEDLAEACRRYGVKLCFYYSQALDWEDPNGGINPPLGTMDGRDFGRYLETKVKTQLRELLTQYGPVGLIWFDVPAHISAEQSKDLADYVKSIQPACLVSGRIGHDKGDYGSLGDNQIPAGMVDGDWETPATMNDTWGFKTHDQNWKSADLLLRQLVGLAGKGVNFLLNVGPDAHGEIPPESVGRLKQIGQWMSVNRAAIHGTRANPYPYDFPWGTITRKPGKLYLLFSDGLPGPFSLVGLRNHVHAARLLSAPQVDIPFWQEHDLVDGVDTLYVDLPEIPADGGIRVLEVDIEGPADVDGRLIQQSDGSVLLPAHLATLHHGADDATADVCKKTDEHDAARAGEKDNQDMADGLSIGPSGLIENWRRLGDFVTWRFHITSPGVFAVRIQTVAEKYKPWEGGHAVEAEVAGQVAQSEIRDDAAVTGDRQCYFEERVTELGEIRIDHPGEQELTLRATHLNPDLKQGLVVSQVSLHRR